MTQTAEPEVMLTPQEVSDILRIDTNTLYKWRTQNKGPAYYKLGKGERAAVRYRKSEVLRFLASARHDTTT